MEDPSVKSESLLCMAVEIEPSRKVDSSDRRALHDINILAAGTDHKIRFWDSESVDSCFIVSGLTSDSGTPSFSLPTIILQSRLWESALPIKLLQVTISHHLPTHQDPHGLL